jgi:tetratricopeptide (TPR) repeat protein
MGTTAAGRAWCYGGVIAVVGILWLIGLTWAAGEAAGSDTPLGTALEQAQRWRYAEAEAACRKAIEQQPELECYARLVLADLYRAQGRIRDAEQEAEKALEAASHDPKDDAGAEMAKKALESCKKEAAWLAALPAASLDAKEQSGVLRRADMLTVAGRYEEAAGLCEALASATPDERHTVVSAVDRLVIYARRAQGEQAVLTRLGKLAEAQKGTLLEAYAVLKIAEALNAGGKVEAADAYERAASLKQGAEWAPTALQRMFCIHERAGHRDEALAAGDKLLATYPASSATAAVLARLTELHREAGNLDEFLARVTQERALSAEGLAGLARACIDEDRMSEAKALIGRLRREHPGSALGPVVLVDFYQRSLPPRLLAGATGTAEEMATGGGDVGRRCEIFYRAALTWRQAADAEKATAALAQAEALFQRSAMDSDLLIRRAYTLMLMGNNKDAAAAMEQARAAEPKNPAVWLGKLRLEGPRVREMLPKDGLSPAELLREAEMLGELGAPREGLEFLESIGEGALGAAGEGLQRKRVVEAYLVGLLLVQARKDLAEADKGLKAARSVAELATDPADKERKLATQRSFEARVEDVNARIRGLQMRLKKLEDAERR